jgi:hypothetical protein
MGISVISLTGIPSNCSQALSLQRSFPGAIQPVSSRSAPMILGFSRRVRGLEQFWQEEVGVLA